MQKTLKVLKPRSDQLLFLPLGGAGEIGMNLNLYGHDGKWLMVDLGVTFGNETTPGIDVIMPDPTFIEDNKQDLAGLLLTHAHEDHLGAVPYLWPRLKCPIYATPFTAAVLQRKFEQEGIKDASITIVPMRSQFKIGPFQIELVTITHSIPEPNAVILRTALGTILHTGDWKIDPSPVIGDITDEKTLKSLAGQDVLALVGDSTNALVPGHSSSESDLYQSLYQLGQELPHRMVVTCFASNVARLKTIMQVATSLNRKVALVGRSLWRIYDAAVETGYLHDLPKPMDEEEVQRTPRQKLLMICTGSQGESRSALSRIVHGTHANIKLEQGDGVIFSSRVIPGNEQDIHHLQDALVRLGVRVISDRDAFVHVSGHPAQDELTTMYQWVRPKLAIPVHGEERHMRAHAELARNCQVPKAVPAHNGQVIEIAPRHGEIIDQVPVGRWALDGNRLISMSDKIVKDRWQMAQDGLITITIVVDDLGWMIADPSVQAIGFSRHNEQPAFVLPLTKLVRSNIENMSPLPISSVNKLTHTKESLTHLVRRYIKKNIEKYPLIDINVIKIL
ncbi:MAG: ribonuclease J [Alphaproteobacteria bacterium]|nr:ribonuclease J [Alphaproteobacteria bacterium]